MLADVERLEMEAVGADFHQERVDEHLGETVAVVLDEAGADGGDVADEVGGTGVGLERGGGGERDAGLRRGSETHHDAGDEQAEVFEVETLFECGLAGGAELGEVAVEEALTSAETGTCWVELPSCSKTFCRRRR